MELTKVRTCLLIHDMINEMTDPEGAFYSPKIEPVINHLLPLVELFAQAQLPVIYAVPRAEDPGIMAHFYPQIKAGALQPDTHGTAIDQRFRVAANQIIARHPRYGAFFGTDLHERLQEQGIKTIIIGGTSTNVGCDVTLRDAANRDYQVILLSDGCLTRPIADKGWGVVTEDEVNKVLWSIVSHSFGYVLTVEEVVKLLLASKED